MAVQLNEVLLEMTKNNRKARLDIEATIYATKLISKMIAIREERKLTQKQLAELTGEKPSYIARIESLDVIPSIETLLKIFLALDCKLTFDKETITEEQK